MWNLQFFRICFKIFSTVLFKRILITVLAWVLGGVVWFWGVFLLLLFNNAKSAIKTPCRSSHLLSWAPLLVLGLFLESLLEGCFFQAENPWPVDVSSTLPSVGSLGRMSKLQTDSSSARQHTQHPLSQKGFLDH